MFSTYRQRRRRAQWLRAAALLCLGVLLFLPEDLSWLSQGLAQLSPVSTVQAGEPAPLR